MKKIISLALVFTFCLLALISCTKIEKDPMDLVKNLRKNGYSISMSVDDEDLEGFAEWMDVNVDEKDVICVIVAYEADEDEDEDEDPEPGYFVYCKNKKTAKALLADIEEAMDEGDDDESIIVRKGKVVYYGPEDVLKAAK